MAFSLVRARSLSATRHAGNGRLIEVKAATRPKANGARAPITPKEEKMVEKSHTSGFWPSLYDPFRALGGRVADWFAPASEASATDGGYTIRIEVPGVEEKDIDLSVHDGVVTVKGEKRTSREEKGETWYFTEREYGSFSRSFRLPPDADEARVSAELKDGVLVVTVPKVSPEAAKGARKVAISKG
jgi:HSP20 family protein